MSEKIEAPRITNEEGRSFPAARSPLQFQKKDWIEIAKRVKREVDEDRVGMVAAATAYYVIFALFPLLIAMVSVYGLFADPIELEQQINQLYQFMPPDAAKVVEDQLHAIVSNSNAALSFGVIFSILVALWTASSGTKAIMEALNIAYDENEKRGFIKLNLQALGLTFGAILVFISAFLLIAVLPAVLNMVGLGAFSENLLLIIRWPLLATLFIGSIAVVNRFGPSRKWAKWRWVSVGSLAGALMILAASGGLALYIEHFGSYNKTYGSIAGVIVLLLWLFLCSYAILLGAEINAEVEHQTAADSTVGPERPMGRRGALMADSLPSH